MSYKNLTISAAGCVLGFMAATAAIAGGPGAYDPPQDVKHFTFYAEGVFSRASEDSSFVEVVNGAGIDSVAHHKAKTGFGGTIGGAYQFNNRSDVRADYTYLPGKFADVASSAVGLVGSALTLKTTYQAVNIDVGQNWNPVEKLTLHFFTGIAYRHYENDSSHPLIRQGDYYLSSGNNKYNGWGPRFGIDSSYRYFDWNNNQLSLIANTAITLPYGTLKAKAQKNGGSDAVHMDSVDKFAPEVAGNLGLQFNHKFKPLWLAFGAGYRVIHIINSDVDTKWLASGASTTTGLKFHDITYYGPYIRLTARF